VTLDALQRPTKIEVKGYGTSPGNNGAPVMNHRYQYDEVSNISQKTSLDGDYVYDYDDLDRLTKAEPPVPLRQSPENPDGLPVEGFNYDPVHNREFSAHQPGAWIYNANNELTQWGQGMNKRQLTYDANGSTIKEQQGNPVTETTDYVYDAQDRLIEVKKNGASVAKYAYDPMGRRVWREAGSVTTWFLYSDEGLIEELASATNTIRTYGWNPGGLWGTDTVWQKDANGTFLTNNDHLYTTDLLTKATDGAVAWSGLREAFGKTSVRPEAATEYLIRFPGQWEDSVGGFNQNLMRHYNSLKGRYLEADPSGLSSINLWSYTDGQVITRMDPLGLISWSGVYALGGISLPIPPAGGIGGDYLRFHLISECVDNKRAKIIVDAGGLALNFGLSVPVIGLGLSTVSVEDHLSNIDPYAMQGSFEMDTFGTFAYAWMCTAKLGIGEADCKGWAFSTDILNLTAISGTSIVKEVKYECCEN
jgi:RHS repeat-associated protein